MKTRTNLAGKGLATLVIGVLLLIVIPNLMRAHLGPTIGQVLRPAGWVALMLGAVLLVLNYFVQRSNQAPAAEPTRSVTPVTAPLSKKLAARKPPAAPVAPPAPLGVRQQASWSPVVLADIEWRRFEALSPAFYAQAGARDTQPVAWSSAAVA